MNSLHNLRQEWEHTLTIVAEHPQPDHARVLVVLKDKSAPRHPSDDSGRGPFHCHRYCKFGEHWDISVDAQGVSAEVALN